MGHHAQQTPHGHPSRLDDLAARITAARFGSGVEGIACGQGLLVETAALPEGVDGVLVGDRLLVRRDAARAAVVLALVAFHVLGAADGARALAERLEKTDAGIR